MKIILQSEAAECGLASLAMIAGHYGYQTNLGTLRQKYPQSLKGANLQQLINVSDALKLNSRALKLDIDDLPKLKLPCIIHWDMNHFVVLNKVSKSKVEIFDPAIGKRNVSMKDVLNHFTGVALELLPSKAFKKEDSRITIKLSQFYNTISGIKPALFQLLLLSLVLQIFTLAAPYYVQLVLDEVIPSYDNNLLIVLALGFGFLRLFNVATTAMRGFVVIHLGASLNQQLAFNLFRHLLRLPLDYFAKRHIGDIVSRFGSLKQIKSMLTNDVVEALIDGLSGTLLYTCAVERILQVWSDRRDIM